MGDVSSRLGQQAKEGGVQPEHTGIAANFLWGVLSGCAGGGGSSARRVCCMVVGRC